jgi:signal transduction histidine kinase/ActR/RegA family two-component response regulator
MRPFRDLPIRHKLLLTTFTSSAAALVLASGGFLFWDLVQFRSEIGNDVEAQARIVSENSAAPLTFRDERTAGETLAVLSLRPRIEKACLYAADGGLFATFHRDAGGDACPAESPPATSFGWDSLEHVSAVRLGQERLGTLYIHRELSDVYDRLRVGASTAAGLLFLAIAAAFLIARRMQRAIANPLLDLAETARAVSSTRNYRLRAVAASNDEVGVVVYAFNDMLDRIAERTAELSRANADLETEVDERRRAEAERAEALERERDANRLKDEFLATLSHELRTPLNAVLGWTRVLRAAQVEPATVQRALESIERNARAQARLIEDLLEVSRIVTGKLRIQVRPVDLAAVVDAATEVVQPAAQAKRIGLSVSIGVRPAMTSGDPDRLQQVVWNVLSNAVKFTPPGGTVSVKLESAHGYRLTIRDSGQGIEPRFLPHIFEPFRQADGSASREHGGLGLGLAIARQLVELHGGTIQAQSDGRGQGAAFEIHLPSVLAAPLAADAGASPTDRALPPAEFDASLLRDVRVLVVDDEEDARVLLETTLTQYGAEVTTAASVAEAFAAIDRRAPDVLLSDVGMPHEDGYSLIRRLRARGAAAGGEIPAIAVTAYASVNDRLAAVANGYSAHIAKPFEPHEVATLVAQLGKHAEPKPS